MVITFRGAVFNQNAFDYEAGSMGLNDMFAESAMNSGVEDLLGANYWG